MGRYKGRKRRPASSRSRLSDAVDARWLQAGIRKFKGDTALAVCDSLISHVTRAARLCLKTPSSGARASGFSPGKDGEAGDIGSIVDGVPRAPGQSGEE